MAAAPEISVDAAIAVSPELDGIFTKKENKSGIDGFFSVNNIVLAQSQLAMEPC